MIDRSLQPETAPPMIRDVILSPALEADGLPALDRAERRDRDSYVQWGRCGLVPASLAHEPSEQRAAV